MIMMITATTMMIMIVKIITRNQHNLFTTNPNILGLKVKANPAT